MAQGLHLAASVGLGFPMGYVLAVMSLRLADAARPPSPARALAFILGGAGCAAWAACLGGGANALLGALLGWQLLLLASLDAEHLWLPRVLTLPLIGSGLAVATVFGPARLADCALGAAAGFLALRLLGLAYRRLRGREGLGGGDAYLLAGGGAWVGWIALPSALVWAALAGLAYAGLRAVIGRPLARHQPIPFGVFLSFGIWLAWLYGPIGRGG
ncbi:MAG: A24 family peptidase [Phenylobacterium sp.]|uniref:A24 family peptidase n=1 Tax=Phenylobacterium sp. TaxID=1871053 RepID=UPI002A36FA51|nr:A24 family peptidase [Phenylobacterium sp.]MDX9998107.1 A24 family peptidase [Phenylobacterium sp.]